MKTYLIAIGLLAGLLATQTYAADAPKRPGPEHKKLEVLTGKWDYVETHQKTPFGPAGRGSYRSEAVYTHGGFFVEERGKGHTPAGAYSWTWIVSYDPERRAYRSYSLDSDGVATDAPATFEGNTWSGSWESKVDGKSLKCRNVTVYASDGRSCTYEWSYSEDGVTWKPWLSGKATKVGKAK